MMPDLISFEQQGEEIRSLLAQLQNRNLVHACLITGEKGVGKRTLARLIASSLLCRSAGERPCGVCSDCLMAARDKHPDLITIQKGQPISADVKKDRATIPVDDIREMIRLCSTHTFDGKARVVLIFDADKMTPQAQNCLLKTLEEPPDNTYIILVTEHPDILLSTVVSRTRPVHLHAWPDQVIRQILDRHGIDPVRATESAGEARGSIGKALELASDEEYWQLRNEIIRDFFGTLKRSDILRISNSWKERRGDADKLLEILESLIRIMTEEHFHSERTDRINAFSVPWQNFARRADVRRFTGLMDAVGDVRRQLQSNVNFQAVLEHLLFILMGEGNQWSV